VKVFAYKEYAALEPDCIGNMFVPANIADIVAEEA
jgi:hypothetical protein